MTVRDAQPRDFDAIVRLNLQAEHFMSRMDRARLDVLASQAVYLRVAEVDGEVAAFLIAFAPGSAYSSENYRWFAGRYGDFIYIDRIAVDERHRGRGLGARLYEDLFAFAREKGSARVVCEFDVDPPNPVSAKFHARFGFREVGSRRVSYADKRVSMQESLMHPPAIARWHELVATRNARGLADLIAPDCVFHSPVVHTPQAGKAKTCMYLGAAMQVFFNPTFRYVRQVIADHDAVLEFELSIDGTYINGVDMIRWNDAGQITDFKVMIRPLQALNAIHQKMAAMLQGQQQQ
jgi:predicted GNAT superfamily acetyltransferase/ketosteroid isomerase-like protein